MLVAREDLDQLWKVLRILGWSAVVLIIAAPAVAMSLGAPGVNWTASDFVFAGVLLVGGAVVIELVAWRVRNPGIRIGFALFIILIVAAVWVEAAVGIFH